jgi:glycosyltransferase involved in cell wall biosynthesis
VPGDLATPTGGYAYDRRVIEEMCSLGWQIDVLDLGAHFPNPSTAQRDAAQDILTAARADAPLVIDGLALGVIPEIAAQLAATHRLVGLVHHPLALETGVTPEAASALKKSERDALAHTARIITSSVTTAKILIKDYGVNASKISTVVPGTDPARPAAPRTTDNEAPPHLLAVGSLVPRKGYDVLIRALAKLAELPWRLTIVGDDTRNAATAGSLAALVKDEKLDTRIALTGAVSEAGLEVAYRHADIFVQPSHFEGYGMAAASAIAYGLPVIATSGGALGDTVADAAIVVPPGDIETLATALHRVITDLSERERLRQAARTAAAKQQRWETTAQQFAAAIEAIS